MGRIEDLGALRERAQTIGARLQLLNKRIREIQDGPGSRGLKAIVDLDRCIACGKCAEECPEGSILINKTAHVDPRRCTGCGRCINQCPQAAISLSPA